MGWLSVSKAKSAEPAVAVDGSSSNTVTGRVASPTTAAVLTKPGNQEP